LPVMNLADPRLRARRSWCLRAASGGGGIRTHE
jgi:hypothetical protein